MAKVCGTEYFFVAFVLISSLYLVEVYSESLGDESENHDNVCWEEKGCEFGAT